MEGPRRAAAVVLVATILAGCAAAGSPAPTPAPDSPGPSPGLQVVVASTSIWAGDATVLIALETPANDPIELPGARVIASFAGVGGVDGGVPVAATGRFVRPEAGGRGLYRVDARLPSAGRWRLDVRLEVSGVPAAGGSTEFLVRDPGTVPAVGAPAPRSRTPTAADVGSDLRRLTSDPQPETSFYWLSEPDALDAGRPFALILDSWRFRESQACGGALGVIRHLSAHYPTVSFIHAEPFVTSFDGTALALDPAGGPARLAPWAEAWGLGGTELGASSVPWIFVVGADGRVAAVFQGVVGSEELALALSDVAGWAPTSG